MHCYSDGTYDGFFNWSTGGSSININSTYGSLYITSTQQIQVPQNVVQITRLFGVPTYMNGGVGFVQVSDNGQNPTSKTPRNFYIVSATSLSNAKVNIDFRIRGFWR